MWLNLDCRRVAINGICDYVTTEDIQSVCMQACQSALAADNKDEDGDDKPQFSIKYVRIAGHLHSVHIPPCDIGHMKQLKTLIYSKVSVLVNNEAQRAMSTNEQLVTALKRHSLQTSDVVINADDYGLLFQV